MAAGVALGGAAVTVGAAAVATAAPAPRYFVVPTGPCAGTYDGVFISTDLEPDDAAALKVLAPRLAGTPLLVVVGEGDAPRGAKCVLAAEMLASYGLDDKATVVQGRGSGAVYPEAALHSYQIDGERPRPHRATIVTEASEEEVAGKVAAFCDGCEAPFALLLKPPHEAMHIAAPVLRRVVAAAYGSFNFVELREGLRRLKPGLSEEMAFQQQEALLHAFRTCLWVERSNSVGRDATLSDVTTDPVWPAFAADGGLIRLVTAWNQHTVVAIAAKVGQLKREVDAILQSKDVDARFDAIAACVSRHEKRLAIMASIADTHGRQMPLADPLVSALLLDDDGRLTPYVRRCRAGHDAKGRPTTQPDEASSVAAVVASGREEAAALCRATLEVLAAAGRGDVGCPSR